MGNVIWYNNAELYHHGILGQHWGIRRFQNKDGSLTPRGEKRVQKLERSAASDYRVANSLKKAGLTKDASKTTLKAIKKETEANYIRNKAAKGEKAFDNNQKIKKILKVTLTAAAVVGAVYVGKKYFDSKKAKQMMYSNLNPKRGSISGLFNKNSGYDSAMKRVESARAKSEAIRKQALKDHAITSGIKNPRDLARYMKGGKTQENLIKRSALKDKAFSLGIKDPEQIKKLFSKHGL